MLSSQHDALSISFWLERWIVEGAKIPKAIVCDFSRALLNAAVKAFTRCNDLNEYICKLHDAANNGVFDDCLIRVDICHFVKIIARFDCYANKRTKYFFTKSICLLIFCKNFSECETIIEAIIICSQSEWEGSIEVASSVVTEKQSFLRKIIEENHSILPSIEIIDAEEGALDQWDFDDVSHKKWVETTVGNSMNKLISGNLENPLYSPGLIKKLQDILKTLPLWSNMTNCFLDLSIEKTFHLHLVKITSEN